MFVGAGLSVPFGYPGWIEFLRTEANRVGVEIAALLRRRHYEGAAQALVAAKGREWLERRIRRTFGKVPSGQPHGAARVLPRLAKNAVITTNFDGVLEEVFRDAGVPFDYAVWGGHPAISTAALTKERHVLIKIHGDARSAERRVLTREEYKRSYGSMQTPLARALRSIISARPLLFVGCRLENDRYLRFLRRAKPPDRGTHFAVVPIDGGPRWLRARRRYLRMLHIEPIWYEAGAYDEITRFLEELAEAVGERARPGETHRTAIAYLEKLLRESRDVDEKLNLLIGNARLFTVTGLSAEYLRFAPRIIRLAAKHQRYCKALLIANNCASAVIHDERELGRWIRRCELLARHCRRPGPLEDFSYNAALAAERHNPAKARRIYRKLSKRRNSRAIAALRRWGDFEIRSGSWRTGLQLLRRAIRRADRFPLQQARAWNQLGMALWDRRDNRRAAKAYETAATLYERLANAAGLAAALSGLGTIALDENDWRRAEDLYARALHHAQVAHATNLVSTIRGNQAEALFREVRTFREPVTGRMREKLVEADEELVDSIAQEDRPRSRAHLRTQRALLTSRLRDPRTALAELAAAARVLRSYPDDTWRWTNYSHRSWILDDAGQIRRAIRVEKKALQIAQELQYPIGIFLSKRSLADLKRKIQRSVTASIAEDPFSSRLRRTSRRRAP